MYFYDLCDRKFQLWFYQVSHSEAIIRSHSCDSNEENNLDIYLGGIRYLEIPCVLDGLKIKEITADDTRYLSNKINQNISEKETIVLAVGEKRHYIVASMIKILKNELPFEKMPIHVFFGNNINKLQSNNKREIEDIRTHRKFQLWYYQIIHSEAIIRSNKSKTVEDAKDTIDIHVKNIQYFEVPYIFRGLEIKSANKDDIVYIRHKMNQSILPEQIMVLLSEGRRYYIVADDFQVYTSNLDYSEMPISQCLVSGL